MSLRLFGFVSAVFSGMIQLKFLCTSLNCSICCPFSDAKMTAILDQKHYIEELNRHLSGTVTDLQAKMDSLEKTNSKLVEEVGEIVIGLCVHLGEVGVLSLTVYVNKHLYALGVFHLADQCVFS